MQTSFSLKFFLYDALEKTTPAKIYLRIIVNRKKVEICLHQTVIPQNWDPDRQRSKNDKLLNEELTFLENKNYQVKRELQYNGKEISALLIKKLLQNKEDSQVSKNVALLKFFQSFLEKCSQNRQEYSEVVIYKYHTAAVRMIKDVMLK